MPEIEEVKETIKTLRLQELRELRDYVNKLLEKRERGSSQRPSSKESKPSRRIRYTYRQEYVKCGKPRCKCAEGEGHGPYWYQYWQEDGRLKKRYLGKKKPPRS